MWAHQDIQFHSDRQCHKVCSNQSANPYNIKINSVLKSDHSQMYIYLRQPMKCHHHQQVC